MKTFRMSSLLVSILFPLTLLIALFSSKGQENWRTRETSWRTTKTSDILKGLSVKNHKKDRPRKRDLDGGIITAGLGGTVVGFVVFLHFVQVKNWLGVAVAALMVVLCCFIIAFLYCTKDKQE